MGTLLFGENECHQERLKRHIIEAKMTLAPVGTVWGRFVRNSRPESLSCTNLLSKIEATEALCLGLIGNPGDFMPDGSQSGW